MIDWLELLWRAAEEGEASLPPEEELPLRRGAQSEPNARDLEGGTDITAALTALRVPLEGAEFSVAGRGTLSTRAAAKGLRGAVRPRSGVGMLYRAVREAAGPLVTANSLRERRSAEEETPRPTGLTEGMLDRAMRRDSRRYDSGMTIY